MSIKNKIKKIKIEDVIVGIVFLGAYLYFHLNRERRYINFKEREFGDKRLKNIEIYKLHPEEIWKQFFFLVIAFTIYLLVISVIK